VAATLNISAAETSSSASTESVNLEVRIVFTSS
jgi:hypothetical protein